MCSKHNYIFLLLALFFVGELIGQQQALRLADIRLNGLQRVSEGSVLSVITLNKGDFLEQHTIAQNIRNIFELELFDQVTASILDGNILIFNISERPSISSLELEGNKALKSEDLLKSLSENGIAEGNIYNPIVINGVNSALEREYVTQGHYNSSVKTELKYLTRNRVKVKILIDEGKKTVIRRINIIGNKVFDDKELLKQFELRKAGFFAAFSKRNKYSKSALESDLEKLESFYLDKGYLEFKVDSVEVSISNDKKHIYISVHITEGEVFQIGKVELVGDFKVPEERLRPLIIVKEGEQFSQAKLTSIKDWINQLHSNLGYLFSEVEIIKRPRENEDGDVIDKLVDIDFLIKPGNRTYVRRIEFKGNTKTKDEVLRRQVLQYEAAPASKDQIEYSQTRLERLVNFESVTKEELPVAGSDSEIDIIYTVKEQNSGSVSGSIGHSDLYQTVIEVSLSEQNFLGTGNAVVFSLSKNIFSERLALSYSNPFFTLDGINSSISISANRNDYSRINISSYQTDSAALDFNIGYPIGNTQRINYGLRFNQLLLKVGPYAPEEIVRLSNGDKNYSNIEPSIYWQQSALNRGLFATGGFAQSLGVNFSLPFSELTYYRLNYSSQFFLPIKNDWVLKFRNNLGYGDGYDDTDRLPFFHNFYAGGFGSIRGFEGNTLGPRVTPVVVETTRQAIDENGFIITDDANNVLPFPSYTYNSNYARPIGGNVRITGTAELLLGFSFLTSNRSIQSSLFLDYGNIFDTNCGFYPETTLANGARVPIREQENCHEPSINEFRYSVGIGFNWLSALGPMSFSVGNTFNQNLQNSNGQYSFEPERSKFFQFTVGRFF